MKQYILESGDVVIGEVDNIGGLPYGVWNGRVRELFYAPAGSFIEHPLEIF